MQSAPSHRAHGRHQLGVRRAEPVRPQTMPSAVVAAAPGKLHDLQQWILSRLSERLGIPATAIDIHQPFARYGIDSLKAVRLTGELEEHLGRPVAPTSLYDYPNIAALVRLPCVGQSNGQPGGRRETIVYR